MPTHIATEHEAWKHALGHIESQSPGSLFLDTVGPGICDVLQFMAGAGTIDHGMFWTLKHALEYEYKANRLPKSTSGDTGSPYWWAEDDRISRIAAVRHMVNITRPRDVFDDEESDNDYPASGGGRTEESPSYRDAMRDAGRGHLLP